MQSYERVGEEDYGSSDDLGEERIGFLSDLKQSTTNGDCDSMRLARKKQSPYRIAFLITGALIVVSLGLWRFASLAIEMLSLDHTSEAPHKALVLASYSTQNTTWLDEVPEDWQVFKYNLDDPLPSTNFTVPRNQGREAMAYLTFILAHYDNLPDYVVFLHGHSRSWHQTEPMAWKLRALNLELLDAEGYINFRCGLKPGCSNETILGAAHPDPRNHPLVRQMMPRFWSTMFQPEHGRWNFGPYPPELGQPCCAQFGVTRERILARPKEFYASYRRPMERDISEYKPMFGDLWDGYRMGILYEHTWHVVFGKEPLLCPDAEFCRAAYFQDMIRCENYTGDYEHSWGWRKISCSNTWDNETRRVEFDAAQTDAYGGWDGVKDPVKTPAVLDGAGTTNNISGENQDLAAGTGVAVSAIGEHELAEADSTLQDLTAGLTAVADKAEGRVRHTLKVS